MSALNWQQMTARERDALVAEKIMGWTRCGHPTCNLWHTNEGINPSVLEWLPTTCPKACAEVKSKAFEYVVYKHCDGTWSCDITISSEGNTGSATGCGSEEEAVSLAALRALGVEV